MSNCHESDSFIFLHFFLKVCWAPCCSFFRRAFCVRFCLCFLFFSGCGCCCVVVCVVVCVVCVCSKLLVGVFKIFGPLPPPPLPRRTALPLDRPKFPLFFLSLPPEISFSLLSLGGRGVFSWNCGRGSRPWSTQNVVSVGVILCVFLFGSGCWAPCCSFFRLAF